MTSGNIDATLRRKLSQAWKLLEANGQAAAARSIRERFDQDEQTTPTVVVIGEAKRGKSSLINALVGAEVAPIGVDIVTGAYVSYVPVNVDHDVEPGAARIFYADGGSDDIALEELEDWVTVEGEKAHGERGVVSATARLRAPGALDVILVDTPGVGGLVAGHGDLALRAAREATALVFVTDAGQDFTAPEKAFLEQAAADIDTVIFAVTKIDKHPVSWQEMVDRDRALLTQHAPRFAHADIVGVSSTMAMEAAAADDPEVAEVLREEARLDRLVAAVTERVSARSGQLATLNAMRATVSALRTGMNNVQERIAAIQSAEAVTVTATAEQEELKELQKHSQRWGREFDLATGRLRRALLEKVAEAVADLEHRWRGEIAEMRPAMLRDENVVQQKLAAFAGEVSRVSGTLLDEHTAALNAEVQALFAKDLQRAQSVASHIAELAEDEQGTKLPSELPPVATQGLGQYLLRSGMSGFGFANLAGFAAMKAGIVTAGGAGMMGGMAALGPAAIPAVAVFGLAMAFNTKRIAQAEMVRGQLREHGAKTLQRVQQQVVLRADDIAAELRPMLLEAMESYIEQRALQLKEVVKEAQAAAHAEPRERQRRIQPLQKMLNTFTAAVRDFESTLARATSGTPQQPAASKEQTVTAVPGSPW